MTAAERPSLRLAGPVGQAFRPAYLRRLESLPHLVPILLAAALLTGCAGSLLRKPVEKHYYLLDAVRPVQPMSGPVGPTPSTRVLTVRRFRVSPPYDGAQLVYRRTNDRYEADFYHEFFIAPASMYTERAARWLEASGLFSRVVVESASGQPATHTLEGTVTTACGDFRDPARPLAVLDVQLLLLDVTRAAPRVVAQKVVHAEVPLAHTAPQDVVAGLGEGLHQALAEFETAALAALEK